MDKILIVKLGALGDVVRTTPLLRVLKGEITWITRGNALPLLPSSAITTMLSVGAADSLKGRTFDLVLSLDDEADAARAAMAVEAKQFVGAYVDGTGKLSYTESARPWFDMGLISRFGIEHADELKKMNERSFQEILFEMLGLRFQGEEYLINKDGLASRPDVGTGQIAIEARAGDRWPNKRWAHYEVLAGKLVRDGFPCVFLQQRDSLAEYLLDIDQCDFFVTGDTLAMHLALALGKWGVGLFTCTSPTEIYDYGRLAKIISPVWKQGFYRKECDPKITTAIPVSEVYERTVALFKSQQKTSKPD